MKPSNRGLRNSFFKDLAAISSQIEPGKTEKVRHSRIARTRA
jgi:hypothetical protein